MPSIVKRFFKRLFPPVAVAHHDSPFPDINHDNLRRELKVIEHAKEEGARNLPDSHSVRAASYEQTIVLSLSQIANDTSQNLTTVLKSHEQTAQLANAQYDQTALKSAVESYETEVEGLLAAAKPDVNERLANFAQCKLELQEFRSKHRLRRQAEYPESFVLTWSILGLIIVIESLMNGYFFSEGSRSGLLGGFGQAAMISLVNVLVAAAVAILPARLISHRNIALKTFGGVVTVAYFVFLIVALLFLTQYRDAFTSSPDNALQAAFKNIRAGNWEPSDINSYLFFALTLLFALGAFFKVLYADDLYFGYGRIWRKAEAEKSRVLDDRDTLMSNLEDRKDKCLGEIERFGEEIEDKVHGIHDAVKSHNRLLSLWDPFGQSLVTCHDALVADYRTANRKARSDTPPEWFRETTPFQVSMFRPEISVCNLPNGLPKLLSDYKQLEAETNAVLGKTHNRMINKMHSMLSLNSDSDAS